MYKFTYVIVVSVINDTLLLVPDCIITSCLPDNIVDPNPELTVAWIDSGPKASFVFKSQVDLLVEGIVGELSATHGLSVVLNVCSRFLHPLNSTDGLTGSYTNNK